MSSQRRFKAIDDYPSKFDWPGIKGLTMPLFPPDEENFRKQSTVPTFLFFLIHLPTFSNPKTLSQDW